MPYITDTVRCPLGTPKNLRSSWAEQGFLDLLAISERDPTTEPFYSCSFLRRYFIGFEIGKGGQLLQVCLRMQKLRARQVKLTDQHQGQG